MLFVGASREHSESLGNVLDQLAVGHVEVLLFDDREVRQSPHDDGMTRCGTKSHRWKAVPSSEVPTSTSSRHPRSSTASEPLTANADDQTCELRGRPAHTGAGSCPEGHSLFQMPVQRSRGSQSWHPRANRVSQTLVLQSVLAEWRLASSRNALRVEPQPKSQTADPY